MIFIIQTFNNINHEKGTIDIKADKEYNLTSNDKVTVKAKTVEISADDGTDITGAHLNVGDATDSTILGTTYRTQESTLNNLLMAAFQTAGAACAITPLTALAPAFAAAAVALQSFEAQAPTYLSTKNKSD